MEKLDFNKIATIEELEKISEDDKNRLITLASIESNKLNSKDMDNIIAYDNKHLKVKEILNIGLYKDFPKEHKDFIATYIMYDSEKIIKVLLDFNIDFKIIKAFATRILELKQIYSKNPDSDVFKSDHFLKIMSVINKLCFLVRNKFKGQDDYLIINKLICLSIFDEDLYLQLEKQKTKKPQ